MFRTNVPPFREKIDVQPEHLCTVDQFDAQDFNLNDAGYIRNSISALSRATSQSQYDAIMRRLVELKNEGNIKPDTKVEDAISQIIPRYCQSPNELERFMEYTNEDFMKRLDEQYKDMRPKEVKEVQASPSPEPASASE